MKNTSREVFFIIFILYSDDIHAINKLGVQISPLDFEPFKKT
jgi:hypothetical protein